MAAKTNLAGNEPPALRDFAALATLILVGALLTVADGGALAYGLLLAALVVSTASPVAAVAAIAAALPLVQQPVAIGAARWSLLELAFLYATWSVGVAVAIEMIDARTLQPALRLAAPWFTTGVALGLIAVAAVSLATVADSRYRPDSFREFRWVIVEPVLALIVFRWLIRKGRRALLVSVLIATGAVVAVTGLAQLVTGSGVVIADGAERATGPFRHPNNLALYLERIAVFALGLASASLFRQRLLNAVAGMTVIGLAATLSRGAGAAFLVGAGWIAAATRPRHGWRWLAGLALAMVALLALLGVQRLTDTGTTGATSSRVLIWSSSVEMIRDHPLTGVGLDQFLNQYGRRYVQPAGWPERYTSHPHNLVMDFWLRLGLPGVAVLIGLVALCFRLSLSGPRQRTEMAYRVAASGALIAGAVHGMVDNGFFLPDLAVMTWLFIAILESTAQHAGSDEPR